MALCLPNPKHLGNSKWESFHLTQLIGYLTLALGVFSFNGNIKIPKINY
jgi:hypothetical protein